MACSRHIPRRALQLKMITDLRTRIRYLNQLITCGQFENFLQEVPLLQISSGNGKNSESASRPYVSLQFGFASVEDTDDLADIRQFAIGLVAIKGDLKNSFVEIGRGQNDLFLEKPDERNIFKIHLEYQFESYLIGFLETEVDFDSSTGSDSVRSKLGIEIPLGKTD